MAHRHSAKVLHQGDVSPQSLTKPMVPAPRRAVTQNGEPPGAVRARALLLGVFPPRGLLTSVNPAVDAVSAPWGEQESLDELANLADSAGADVVGRVTQHLPHANPRTYVNEGKAREIALVAEELDAELLIVDDEISLQQQRGLETAVGAERRIVDRTVLILDIFAQRARTREAVVQVQLAQLQYQLPRLARQWTHLERQRGGIGMRGPGETQLESDRRRVRIAIASLKDELKEIEARRNVQRAGRKGTWVTAALVGYTNAGKSTLLNRLAGADAVTRDQLFATLDPLTRRWDLGDGKSVLLTDTVGFIHKLPASLVAAFRATLEEVHNADILIHVVNTAHPAAVAQAEVATAEIAALGARATPSIMVLNKVDALDDPESMKTLDMLMDIYPDAIQVSALTGQGCDDLANRVCALAATI